MFFFVILLECQNQLLIIKFYSQVKSYKMKNWLKERSIQKEKSFSGGPHLFYASALI